MGFDGHAHGDKRLFRRQQEFPVRIRHCDRFDALYGAIHSPAAFRVEGVEIHPRVRNGPALGTGAASLRR